ncbi:hypothetical protein J3P85_16485 [Pseudomonas sp. Z1-12]|uniref:hypothetical protein n=1 Tax=Pseudomonas sp. Z1-12 TaxID=2817408 RepID=UPI003DA8C579
MKPSNTPEKLMACRRLALEQNERLFDEANAYSRRAFDLLEHPDFDCEMFEEYLHIRQKAESLFRDAIEHLGALNEDFPPPSSRSATGLSNSTIVNREMA